MNYSKHYDMLIERASNRTLVEYSEKHHIIPRCLGGTNKKENIVSLTAREHYVAHQLLVKMNPNHHGLIKAAAMMANAKNINVQRFNNRLYEWLRIKHSAVMSESQTGAGNSQYNTRWIHNLDLKESKKIPKSAEVPTGWIIGRKTNFDRCCKGCGVSIYSNLLYCNAGCRTKHVRRGNGGVLHTTESKQLMKGQTHQQGVGNSQHGTCWVCKDRPKKIKKTELNLYLENGWIQGRTIKT